jgi:hypothetical protein
MAKAVPIRRKDFDVPGFASWLAENGAEIGVPSNPYEVVRYLAHAEGHRKPVTHIVYTKENGMLTFTGQSRAHYAAFLGLEGDGSLKRGARPSSTVMRQHRRAIIKRDGEECWFCGQHVTADNSSVEHLVPRSQGGPDTLANFVLAHPACNQAAGDMPLGDKIAMRDRLRKDRVQ